MYRLNNKIILDERVSSKVQEISQREREVLLLAATGLNPAYIADELKISTSTVSQHLKNIRVKLKAKNTTHAVAHALTNNIICM